jgi:hypothetical protein
MDAIFFCDRAIQYDVKHVDCELIKTYASLRPRATQIGVETLFGIVTGNCGSGIFNCDRQLKGIN